MGWKPLKEMVETKTRALKPSRVYMTPELGEMILLLYPDHTAQEIAEVLGTTDHSVAHYAQRHGVLRRTVKGRSPKLMTPELGEMITLMYQDATADTLAAALGLTTRSVHHYAWRHGVTKAAAHFHRPLGYERPGQNNYLMRKITDEGNPNNRFQYVHVLAWEQHQRRKKPPGHVIVILDGDKRNFEADNLYCLPKAELLAWMRFIGAPVEVHVDRLIRRVMALDTSEAVKKKLLEELERIVDPDKPLDIHRQRAMCETVQTLVNLLKVEIDYLRAIEGDGRIPFLETKHTERARLKKLPKDPLLSGPSPEHSWRKAWSRLGSKNSD